MTSRTTNEKPWTLLAVGLLAATVFFVAFVRLRLADFPLERDEGEYAYIAQLLSSGVAPYAEAYSMKMPGVYAVYAAVMASFGPTAFAIRLGLLLVSGLSMLLVFALGRRLADERTGAVAGSVYGLMSLSISVFGPAAHATHFVVPFAVGGLLLLLRAIESRRTGALFASGALLGLAYTMKQHGVVFAVFGALWIFLESRGESTAGRGPTFRRLAAFGAGALAPFIAVSMLLFIAGVFERFWFWNFVYAASYASSESTSYGVTRLGIALGRMQPLAGFGALAVVGLFAPIWDVVARRSSRFLVGLLLFSTLSVLPGWHFRHHYFIPMWPAVALLAGVGVGAIARRLNRELAIAALLVAAAVLIVSERAPYFRLSPVEFSHAVYRKNPFPESIEVAAFVEERTRPDERIAVIGSEPQILFYSDRRSATGHLYMYGLTEVQPYSLEMQKELAAEVEAARPALVVLVDSFTSWMWRPGSERYVLEWARSYLERDYVIVGRFEIRRDGSAGSITVFERKDRVRE